MLTSKDTESRRLFPRRQVSRPRCFLAEDVAARAKVGKGAIYRRHPSKDDLVMASVAALVDEEIVVPDTGSTRADLLALMREAVELYRGSLPGRLMPNLVSAMAERPELARVVREGFPGRPNACVRSAPRRSCSTHSTLRAVREAIANARPDAMIHEATALANAGFSRKR